MYLAKNYLDRITVHLRKHHLIGPTETLTSRVYSEEDSKKYVAYDYVIRRKNNNDLIATFSLVEMPGCNGIAISTNSVVSNNYRNHKLGTLLNSIRMDLAADLGYSLLLCTDRVDNMPQRRILKNNKWTPLCQFKNRNTENTISLECKSLVQEGQEIP